MMKDWDKKYNVEASLKDTLDEMKRQLKKYRIDQSTPTNGRFGSVHNQTVGSQRVRRITLLIMKGIVP